MDALKGPAQPIRRRVWTASELDPTTKVVRVSDLRVPIHIATGHFEAASEEELYDLAIDITHERARRPGSQAA